VYCSTEYAFVLFFVQGSEGIPGIDGDKGEKGDMCTAGPVGPPGASIKGTQTMILSSYLVLSIVR